MTRTAASLGLASVMNVQKKEQEEEALPSIYSGQLDRRQQRRRREQCCLSLVVSDN